MILNFQILLGPVLFFSPICPGLTKPNHNQIEHSQTYYYLAQTQPPQLPGPVYLPLALAQINQNPKPNPLSFTQIPFLTQNLFAYPTGLLGLSLPKPISLAQFPNPSAYLLAGPNQLNLAQ